MFFSRKEFSEPSPPAASSESIIHQITHPASLNTIIDRQVVLQNDDNKIRKSVRIHLSNLKFEKEILETVKASTSIPVPKVYEYYRSAEFEHLVLERLPSITLEKAWLTLSLEEKIKIADQVVSFLGRYESYILHTSKQLCIFGNRFVLMSRMVLISLMKGSGGL